MNKTIIAELIQIANECDENKQFSEANELTKLAQRLAQFNGEYEGGFRMQGPPIKSDANWRQRDYEELPNERKFNG